jgi:hypothetical protein
MTEKESWFSRALPIIASIGFAFAAILWIIITIWQAMEGTP